MKTFHGGVKIEEETIKLVEQKDEAAQKSRELGKKTKRPPSYVPLGEYI